MQIEGWYIDAFGALQDKERTGINEGLTVIFGPNEAGKSTLRHFVLGVLFGFPAGNTLDPRYSPANGSPRSGRLFIQSEGEEFVLSRLEKKGSRAGESTLLGPDGKARSDAELSALLGGLTRNVYDKIFAIGLDELNNLKALTDGDLQDHLLSAGVTGAGRVATKARNDLRNRAGELHRARAQSTKVAEIREKLRDVESQLADAQRNAAELHERREALQVKRDRAESLAETEREATQRARRFERLSELWPGFLEAADAADELETMRDEREPVADNALDQLTRTLAALESTSADLTERKENLERALAQLEVLEASHLPELAALQPDLAALQHRLGAWSQQEEEARNREDELAELHRRLGFELDAVGISDKADLGRIGAAVAARDHLRVTRNAFDEKSSARRRAADEVEMQSKEVIDAQAALATATEALGGGNIDLSAQSLRIESDRAAREAMLLDRLSEDLTELERNRRDLTAVEGNARTSDNAAKQSSTLADPRNILVLLAIVLILGAVVGAIVAGPLAGGMLAIAALGVGGASLAMRSQNGGRLGEDARRELEAKVNILDRKCLDSAQMLGFSGLPEVSQVAAAKAERDRQSGALTALVAADNRVETAKSAMRAKKHHLAELTKAHEKALEAWQEWLQVHRLPGALRPEGVEEWLSHLDAARGLDEQIRAAQKRLNELHSALEQAPKSVIELTDRAESASRVPGSSSTRGGLIPASITRPRVDSTVGELQAVVAVIAKFVDEAAEIDNKVARDRDAADVLRGEVTRAQEAQAKARNDLESVYAGAQVTDETEFRRRVAQRERRGQLVAIVDAFKRRLQTESGSFADEDAAQLAKRTPDIWVSERADALEAARVAAAERDEVLREVGAAQSEVATIEQSADLPALALQREELVEALRRTIREWTVLHVAAGIIDHTLERYLDERQPAVLQQAEKHLVTITDGRYTTIRLDPTDESTPKLTVVDAKGRPHEPNGLSKGTVEQVYLCLRLALAEQHHQSLPLLLDDILVNFDPERAEATTRVLADVAKNQQVIVFTCHPWVVEIMGEVVPDLNLVDLENRVA